MRRLAKTACISVLLLISAVTGIITTVGHAGQDVQLSMGQTVYVAIYSHIYSGNKARPFNLAAILSIRNTDINHPVTIASVKYYDTGGKLLQEYLNEPFQLKALASTRYIIKERDTTGGSGANFIVKWKSAKAVNPPMIEAVMIGTHSGQGISFVSRGQVIEERMVPE
jgi:hypothetical protein